MQHHNWPVVNNQTNQRFEIEKDGELAFLEYRFYKNNIALMHTMVPDALEGQGLASALAQHALEWAEANGKLVMVYCPFVATFLKRHPEYNRLLDEQYRRS